MGVVLRTDDAGQWTLDAGPSAPYYKLTGELIKNVNKRTCFTRFRISAHELKIERGRYSQPMIPATVTERYCDSCKNVEIEDEVHFPFRCSFYNDIRKKYFQLESISFFLISERNTFNLKVFLSDIIVETTSELKVKYEELSSMKKVMKNNIMS